MHLSLSRIRGAVPNAIGTVTDLEAAWDELHDAKPDGWFVGQPTYDEDRKVWEQYAFDTRRAARRPGTGRGSGRPSPSPSSRSCARWRGACG